MNAWHEHPRPRYQAAMHTLNDAASYQLHGLTDPEIRSQLVEVLLSPREIFQFACQTAAG